MRCYLEEQKRIRDDLITNAHPSIGQSSWVRRKLGDHCTACGQLNRLESVGGSAGLSLPDSSVSTVSPRQLALGFPHSLAGLS